MKWTLCFFVRDLESRRIVHHEIEEIDTAAMLATERGRIETQKLDQLMDRYPPNRFDVFLQGFDSLNALYASWPELSPQAETP
ncbi:MAG TPA: hypothetical protein VGM90_12810 [Kofleriaceae bacterium]|jgi:hypothetical protein